MSIIISAIICTYNREKYLPKAIQSLVDQTIDPSQYEIIIVDNNSTDRTKEIITEQFSQIFNLRYLYEPIQGLSQARNTGWQNAKGEFVAYLDDDAIASSDWLEKILEAFNHSTFPIGALGGKVSPVWEIPRPSWLSDRLARSLTIIDWSEAPIIFYDDSQWLVGANIAYPKYLLKEVNGFNVNFGRKGRNLLSGEENFLHNLLRKNGYYIYYDPSIIVQHHIPANRLKKNWHLKRRYWGGRSVARIEIDQESLSLKFRLKKILKNFKSILLTTKEVCNYIRKKQNERIFDSCCNILFKIGFIQELAFHRYL